MSHAAGTTRYMKHTGSVEGVGYGKSKMSTSYDENHIKRMVAGYSQPGSPTGGKQGGSSGREMRKGRINETGSKSRNNPYY